MMLRIGLLVVLQLNRSFLPFLPRTTTSGLVNSSFSREEENGELKMVSSRHGTEVKEVDWILGDWPESVA